jgi:type I restriction enzyme R subunit
MAAAIPVVDANLFIRHIRQDHADQSPRASDNLGRLETGELIARTNELVLSEVVYVLQSFYKLQAALATYTQSGGQGAAALDQEAAVRVLLENHDVVAAMFHGFDWSALRTGSNAQRMRMLAAAQEHILSQVDGKQRLLDAVAQLTRAFALAVPDERALALRDDIAFFQAVRTVLAKPAMPPGERPGGLDHALRELVSRAIAPEGVVDIFSAAGLTKPDISVLSDAFLADVERMQHRNLAVDLLQKLLHDQIRTRSAQNVVQSKAFSEKLAAAMRAYENRTIEAAKVVEELIGLAREMRAAQARGEAMGLNQSEVAFYDALAAHGDVVSVMGDKALADIARQLAADLRRSATIDWKLNESARARMRLLVKRILSRYGYPPDQQPAAIETVIKQAELFADELAA